MKTGFRTGTVVGGGAGGANDVTLVDRYGNTFPTINIQTDDSIDLRTLTPFDKADIFLNSESGGWGGSTFEDAFIDVMDNLNQAGYLQNMGIWYPTFGTTLSHFKLNALYPFDANSANRILFTTGGVVNNKGYKNGAASSTYNKSFYFPTKNSNNVANGHLIGFFQTSDFDDNSSTSYHAILTNAAYRGMYIGIRPSDGIIDFAHCDNNNAGSLYTPISQPSSYIRDYIMSRISNTNVKFYIDAAMVANVAMSFGNETAGIDNNGGIMFDGSKIFVGTHFRASRGSIYDYYGSLSDLQVAELRGIIKTFEDIVRA